MGSITVALDAFQNGEPDPADIARIYRELRKLAAWVLRRSAPPRIGTTDLIHGAWLKLMRTRRWDNRTHFFGAAARAMRQVVINEAKRKRPHPLSPDFDWTQLPDPLRADRAALLALDEALGELERLHPRAARVTEYLYFGQLTLKTIALISGTAVSTVWQDAEFARAWLYRYLTADDRRGGSESG